MKRNIGTVSIGIRTPLVKEGDNVEEIVVSSILEAAKKNNLELHDKDVIGITESLVARSQGNYCSVDDIAADVKAKFDEDTVGVVFPILSRNRFSLILKGIAKSNKKVIIQLSYPRDEVGNQLFDPIKLFNSSVNPYSDTLSEKQYRDAFGFDNFHPFTGCDYVELYKEICGGNCEIIFSNNPTAILDYTNEVIVASIHSRKQDKILLEKAGAKKIYGIDEILTSPVNGSGFNDLYGLLGSNFSGDNTLKLFPRNCPTIVKNIQKKLYDATGRHIEVMIYGDGAFKDPVGKIWELADPVVSPGFTDGLTGTPNELKLKYIIDNELKEFGSEEEREQAISKKIAEKDGDITKTKSSLGTTPRRITDLLGSLCDLTSGSGDKGTPVILIQGYFDNFATN